jgi:superkiller protein 3
VFGCGAWLSRSQSYLAHASRGEQLLEENKPEQAIAEIQNSIRLRPDYVPAHFALAHAYFNQQRYVEAEAELKRVLALRPAYEPALYELGMALLNQNKTGEARSAFAQCVALDPGDGHYGMGLALAEEGNDQAAVAEYQQALPFDPDASAIQYQLGVSQARLKNYDEAIAAFRKQQETSGDDYDTELALANAYHAKGMTSEADAAQKKAEKLKPGK